MSPVYSGAHAGQAVEYMDLGALEREAFQRGDTLMAGLAAYALDASTDAEGALANMEKECDEAREAERDAENALSELRSSLCDAVDELGRAIDSAKRIGNREAIEAALATLNELAA